MQGISWELVHVCRLNLMHWVAVILKSYSYRDIHGVKKLTSLPNQFYHKGKIAQNIFCWVFLFQFLFCMFPLENHQQGCKILFIRNTNKIHLSLLHIFPHFETINNVELHLQHPGFSYSNTYLRQVSAPQAVPFTSAMERKVFFLIWM